MGVAVVFTDDIPFGDVTVAVMVVKHPLTSVTVTV